MKRRIAVLLGGLILLSSCRKRVDSPHPSLSVRDARAPAAEHDERELAPLQRRSLDALYYRSEGTGVAEPDPLRPPAPGAAELRSYRDRAESRPTASLSYLDQLYGSGDDLGALAVRDSDGDGTPDFRVSDYFGKFMEGDVDVDGDGVRNVYDSHPFDPARGGRDSDGDGVPDVPGSFADCNRNGLPDHVDWSAQDRGDEIAAIQLGLFRDYSILLVERDAEFDLPLARAVDDTLRLVFGDLLGREGLATLRTVATAKVALLDARLAASVNDNTSAQLIVQTQALVIYDEGRATHHDIGLLGLLVHEVGHAYQLSLDFDVHDLAAENRRTDFPAPSFRALVEPYGWQAGESPDHEEVAAARPLAGEPLFQYMGRTEPTDVFWDESPEAWEEWLMAIYASLDESPDYLADEAFREQNVVSDYSLSTPWEWHSDNLQAYVLWVLETAALESGAFVGGAESRPAQVADGRRLELALRSIWPGFRARNIEGSVVLEHFDEVFPIAPADRDRLVERYLIPAVAE